MKFWFYTLLASLTLAGCSKQEDVFYSTVYPVTEIQVQYTTQKSESDYLAQLEELTAAATTEAPVQAGGYYHLDFSRHNGGELYVLPNEGSEVISGEFDKKPASDKMTFRYGEQAYEVQITSYSNAEEVRCVCFEVDLTEAYKQAYQIEDESFKLIRRELTTHIYD